MSIARTPLWGFRFQDAHISLGTVAVPLAQMTSACFQDEHYVPMMLQDCVDRMGEVLWRNGGLHGGGDATADVYMFWNHRPSWRGISNLERGAYFLLEPSRMHTICTLCADVLSVHESYEVRRSYHLSVRDSVYMQSTYELRESHGSFSVRLGGRRRDDGSLMDDDGPSSLSSG